MKDLNVLVEEVIADGVIDEAEVKEISDVIYADGVIDKEEVEALFKINDACSGNENHESWKALFIKAVSSHVLEDDDTPGVIDEAEGDFIVSLIEGDGEVDDVERDLLQYLDENSDEILSDKLDNLMDEVL